MIEHIDKLRDAGVTSFKIEGRMKSPYYVATVVNAYRRAIDDLGETIYYGRGIIPFNIQKFNRDIIFTISKEVF